MKSRAELETVISQAVSKFLIEYMGEHAEQVTTQAIDDTIIVRFKGVLPPAERQLVKNFQGFKLVKEMKERIMERAKPLLGDLVRDLTGLEVIDIHSTMNLETGEHIEIFTLNKKYV